MKSFCKTLLLLLLFPFEFIYSQQVEDFFHVNVENYEFPVFVRGNLDSNKILLFVQGGPGATAIDFARSDYPGWKNTLEQEVTIAYYDQRGLNQKVKNIDSTKISYHQYSKDLLGIAKQLKNKYQAEIYLLGHSFGGKIVLKVLENFPEDSEAISAGLVINTPITNGYSKSRYNYYRPKYLKNLSKEMIQQKRDTLYWQEAYNWMIATDSIYNSETSRIWNQYVGAAFEPTNRKITLGMIFKVIFSKPYNPFRYMYKKDEEYVSDLLWYDEKNQTTFEHLNQIKKPILFLTGRFDDIAPPEELEDAQLYISKSKLVILPDAAHESFLDQPELFKDEVLNFITEIDN